MSAAARGADVPALSIVVTIVDGGPVLRRFLVALLAQDEPPSMEILVPYDASVHETGAMAREFPTVTFLDMGHVPTERPVRSASGQHELYDRRRSAGLNAARGNIVAILEDRGAPRRDWAKNCMRTHEQPYAVVGGAIECEPGSLLNWAFYVCDFGRYGLPFTSGPAAWVSDVNVSYKRRVLDATRDLWQDRFGEAIVHWALLEKGETLFLSSDVVVQHERAPCTLGALLPERFHWGRLFGRTRALHVGGVKRALYTLSAPLIPPTLLLRHARTQYRKGHFARYVLAVPYAAILTVAWVTGEAWGYITGRA